MIRSRISQVDDPTIYRLIKEQLLPYTKINFPNFQFHPKDLPERLKNGPTYVASKSAQHPCFGFIHLFKKHQTIWIDMLAVDHPYQGRGWGKLLLSSAEHYAKKQNCTNISLFVDRTNVRAQHFYTNQGYQYVRFELLLGCYVYSKTLIR